MARLSESERKSENIFNSARRFTLIELLVVVAIIAILASMLLPTLSRVKRKALQASDVSNRRQSAVALAMFDDDHEQLPTHPARTARYAVHLFKNGGYNLVTELEDYITDFEIWKCVNIPGDVPPIDHPNNTRGLSYSTLSYFADRKQGTLFKMTNGTPSKLGGEGASSSLPILACAIRDHRFISRGVWISHGFGEYFWGGINASNPSAARFQAPTLGQVEGAAISFFDGHAAWVSGQNLDNVGPEAGPGTVECFAVMPDGN